MRDKVKKVIVVLGAVCLVVHPTFAAPKIVKVPLSTPVTLKLLETVTSKTAEVGQRVRFAVEADVIVDGEIVIKKDSPGMGEVTSAGAAGMAGTAGNLTISLQTVQAADGTMIPISATKGAKGQSKLGTSIAVTALCCIFAIFMKGKDVTFGEQSLYVAFTMAPVEVRVP